MARPKLGDSESKRLQMVITEDEVEAIDEWQHANRIASRSEAIRRLVQIALRYEEQEKGLVPLLRKVVEVIKGTGDRWREIRNGDDEVDLVEVLQDEYRKLMRHTNVLVQKAQVGRMQSAAIRKGADMAKAKLAADEKRREMEQIIERLEEKLR